MKGEAHTVDENYIPLFDAFLLENGSEHLDLIQKLLVGIGLFGLGHWTVVVYGRRVPVAGKNVTVDAVVAC